MMLLSVVWGAVAAGVALIDYRRPHSESFNDRQHLANSVVGGVIWPLWLPLMGAVMLAKLRNLIPVVGRRCSICREVRRQGLLNSVATALTGTHAECWDAKYSEDASRPEPAKAESAKAG